MRIRLTSLFFALTIAAVLLPVPAMAQDLQTPAFDTSEPGEEIVDRVAAVVGDSVVLYSEVLELLQQRRAQFEAQGQPFPTDPAALQSLERELLDEIVDNQLLVQAAARDTMVVVTDDQVDRAFDQQWQQRVSQLGGESNLREALEQQGQSLAGFRSNLRDQTRTRLLVEQFMGLRQRDSGVIPVDESEVEAYFERERAGFPARPATVVFRQAIIEPRPSEAAMEEAVAEVERILEMIRGGEDFANLARQFSDDPGSRQEGGDLGWFRRGSDLASEFEDAAFRLREGEVVGPVETSFGAHIIKVERIRGPERRIRHILIGADGDQDGALARAEEIRDAVEGGAPMREFTREYATEQRPDSLELGFDRLEEFPSGYASALRSAEPGTVVGPVQLPLSEDGSRLAYVVIQVLQVREQGEYTLDDLRGQIREFLRAEKFQQRLMDRIRARTYVEIRI